MANLSLSLTFSGTYVSAFLYKSSASLRLFLYPTHISTNYTISRKNLAQTYLFVCERASATYARPVFLREIGERTSASWTAEFARSLWEKKGGPESTSGTRAAIPISDARCS